MAIDFSGLGAASKLGEIIKNTGAKRVFLVTGKGSYKACGAQDVVEDALAHLEVERFWDFDVNPKLSDAQRGIQNMLAFRPDVIVAVGGGSVMDMAKLLKAFSADPDNSEAIAKGEIAVTNPDIPLIALPTTAGSGSESTHFAVVYIGTDKYSLASQHLLPEHVILDGLFLKSGSPYQVAVNGLDALAQGIESAWAAGSTEESRVFAFRAITDLPDLLKSVTSKSPTDDDFQNVMEAANFAGQAINISKTTAAHAWSYSFTSHHGVPHGHAVWLTLPKIFQIHATADASDISDPRGAKYLGQIMRDIQAAFGIENAAASTTELQKFLMDIGIESNMITMGAHAPKDREFLSKQVNAERMGNNPVRLNQTHISQIFEI